MARYLRARAAGQVLDGRDCPANRRERRADAGRGRTVDPSADRTSVRLVDKDVRNGPRGALSRDTLETLVAQDLSVRQIAAAVDRSPGTVIHWLSKFELRTTEVARRRRSARQAAGICAVHGETAFIGRKDGTASCARCRSESVTRWRREAKRTLVAELGGACARCGYSRAIEALHFHHVDPETKRFALGRAMSSSMESLREEAAKCILLCANCHAEEEAKLRGWDSNPQPLD